MLVRDGTAADPHQGYSPYPPPRPRLLPGEEDYCGWTSPVVNA